MSVDAIANATAKIPDTKFDRLVEWANKNGGIVSPKLIMKEITPGNRGLFTKEKIAKDEKFIQIPDRLGFTKASFLELTKGIEINCDFGDGISTPHIDHSRHMYAYVLLHAKYEAEKSFFFPYIDMLPTNFSDHPFYLYLHEKEKVHDKWDEVNPRVVTTLDTYVKDYEKFGPGVKKINERVKLIPDEFLTQEILEWAYFCLITRQWGKGMIPVADLPWHSNKSTAILQQTQTDNVFVATEEFPENANITISYGLCDDETLFVGFGFVDGVRCVDGKFTIDNEVPRYTPFIANITIDNKSPLARLKDSEIKRLLKDKKLFVSDSGINETIIQILRYAALSSEDMKLINLCKENPVEEKISLENEARVINWILSILKTMGRKKETLDKCKEIVDISGASVASVDFYTFQIACLTLFHQRCIDSTRQFFIDKWTEVLDK